MWGNNPKILKCENMTLDNLTNEQICKLSGGQILNMALDSTKPVKIFFPAGYKEVDRSTWTIELDEAGKGISLSIDIHHDECPIMI